MPVATSSSPAVSTSNSPTQTPPLSVHRPVLSPRKRKFSSILEATSPTSLDEVNSTGSNSSLKGREISPKKKTKVEEYDSVNSTDLSKWENYVVVSIANALDLDCLETSEPISFSVAPAGDLATDEQEILCWFLA